MFDPELMYSTRLLNVALSVGCLLTMLVRLPDFITSPFHVRMERYALGVLVATGLVSTIEAIVVELPGGPRVFLLTGALAFLLVSLSLPTGRKDKTDG